MGDFAAHVHGWVEETITASGEPIDFDVAMTVDLFGDPDHGIPLRPMPSWGIAVMLPTGVAGAVATAAARLVWPIDRDLIVNTVRQLISGVCDQRSHLLAQGTPPPPTGGLLPTRGGLYLPGRNGNN